MNGQEEAWRKTRAMQIADDMAHVKKQVEQGKMTRAESGGLYQRLGYCKSNAMPVQPFQICRESYAQCSKACRCFRRHWRSPGRQLFRIWAICRRMARHRFTCRWSSGERRPR